MSDQPESFEEHFAKFWDGEVVDPVLSALLGNDSRFPHISESSLAEALVGFPKNPVVSMDWLALAVKRALGPVTPEIDRMPDSRPTPKDVRDRLTALAGMARKLVADINDLPLDIAAPLSQGLDGPSFRQFNSWLEGVRSLAESLEGVADQVDVRPGAWRNSEAKALRKTQASHLLPVYELAFGVEATVNDRPTSEVRPKLTSDLGAWPDFLARVLKLAMGKELSFDQVRDTAKEARKDAKSLGRVAHPVAIMPPPCEG